MVTGLIPARAGNTRSTIVHLLAAWAHPRSRGEHKDSIWRVPRLMGSSPLARGTH